MTGGRPKSLPGQHKLTIEITAANPRAVKSYMTGLGYVRLEPVK